MQFITSGNRIAVENFVLGDLYTITFTNGTYINSACIGIGDNFVTFQRNEPELLFSLTMATAELVSSIELYAGGTGTNDYEDLTNKPQINDVELVGNKSLSDLGIQATISDIDTIRSGAAAGATAVQPAALADYQPIISDLATIRSGAAAGATAVQPAALAGYQTIIDSSHKLDSDLVDDTTATHKFATAAQLSQIETNKNNISLIKHAANTSIYIQETTPTGAVGDYWISAANGVKTYGRTAQLFNIDDSNMFFNGYINISPDIINTSTGGSLSAIIPCTAGEQYTIAVNSRTLRIASVATPPANNTPIISPYRQSYNDYNKHTYTYTAPEGAIYLIVTCYLVSVEIADEKSIDDIFGTLMINEGTTAAEYAPYYEWT